MLYLRHKQESFVKASLCPKKLYIMKNIILLLFLLLIQGNKLVDSCAYAQDMIVTNDGKTIMAYNTDFSPSNAIYYQLENSNSAPLQKINKSEVLIIKLANGSKVDPSEDTMASIAASQVSSILADSNQYPNVDLSNFHGCLFQAGNCVYIPIDSPIDYEKAGQERFRQRMKMANIWTVVNAPEQAHFVMQFWTSTKGSDKRGHL